uniref:Uncharacterized protein n=1 Tax=Picea glauca TaxID=3330 RepID=A0A101M093_PICGL|nr:hypothetical protein ABT39_MTgene4508 [Picea glauca]QHR87423.1 hypothetical protein Q903MT_gene1433 [Picea sitchensis]
MKLQPPIIALMLSKQGKLPLNRVRISLYNGVCSNSDFWLSILLSNCLCPISLCLLSLRYYFYFWGLDLDLRMDLHVDSYHGQFLSLFRTA